MSQYSFHKAIESSRNAEDADHLNHYNIQQFKETFGGLNFDAGNELLKGTRKIEVSYAPTPITQLRGYLAGATDNNLILPQVHTHEDEADIRETVPVRAKKFIIEPWNDYIMSGDLHDWSHKLVQEKDMVIEPVFFSQSDRIE